MYNISPKELAAQDALGLLLDWIITVSSRKGLARQRQEMDAAERQYRLDKDIGKYTSRNRVSIREHIFVLVKAVNLKHARSLVKQSNRFPEKDFTINNGWQSTAAAVYYKNKTQGDLQQVVIL